MRRFVRISIISICVLALGVGALALFVRTVSVERLVAESAIKLDNDTDFAAITRAVSGARIVILGEAGHTDGRAFEIRCKLVRHLIDECGFDVVALEGAGVLESLVWQRNIGSVWSAVWSQSRECQPLIDAVNSGEVKAFGIDPSVTHLTPAALRTIMTGVDARYCDGIDWARMERISLIISYDHTAGYGELCASDEEYLGGVLAGMKKLCDELLECEGANRAYLEFALLGIENFTADLAKYNVPRAKANIEEDYEALIAMNNIRDGRMAANLGWYLDRNPGHKVVVWCANFHGARDLSYAEYPQYPESYTRTRVLGHHLADRYGDALYSIAFSSPESGKRGLENILARRMDYGFIDFTMLRDEEGSLNVPFHANCMRYKSAQWVDMFDGLYFIREWKESTPVE